MDSSRDKLNLTHFLFWTREPLYIYNMWNFRLNFKNGAFYVACYYDDRKEGLEIKFFELLVKNVAFSATPVSYFLLPAHFQPFSGTCSDFLHPVPPT